LRQRVVLNVSSIPNLHSGSPQESYLWDLCRNTVGRDSVVRIRDSLIRESPCGRHILYPSRPAVAPTQPPIRWVPGLFPRVKAVEAWR
jgi:hypothetical protein